MSLLNWVIKYWAFLKPILTTTIPVIATLITAFIFSEKAVERSQLKRHHSKTLQKSLRMWLEYFDTYTLLKTDYDESENKFVPHIPSMRVEDIPFYRFLIEHLTKGHKELYDSWIGCFTIFERLNRMRADIFENIRQELLHRLKKFEIELKTAKYHPDIKGPHINIDIFVLAIFNIFERKYEKGFFFDDENKPRIREVPVWDDTLKDYVTGSDLFFPDTGSAAKSKTWRTISKLEEILYSVLENESLLNQIQSFMSEKDIFDEKKNDTKRKLEELIEYIELGNNIKGKCKFCPKLFF